MSLFRPPGKKIKQNKSWARRSKVKADRYETLKFFLSRLRKFRESKCVIMKPYHIRLFYESVRDNDVSSVKSLLFQGVDVNLRNSWNRTPLHYAAIFNVGTSHFEMSKLLLGCGADVNALDVYDQPPFHYLLKQADSKMIELFSNYKTNMNAVDKDGEIPLTRAIIDQNYELVKLLVDSGSNVNFARLKEILTPLQDAFVYGYKEKIDEDGANIIRYLVENGANVNAIDDQGCTILTYFVKYDVPRDSRSLKLFELLLEYSDADTVWSVINNRKYESYGHANCIKGCLCKNGRDYWRSTLEHLAKLYIIDNSLYTGDLKPHQHDYFKTCVNELIMAKHTWVRQPWLNYYDLLMGSGEMTVDYAVRQNLIQDFKKGELEILFPTYGATIWENLDRAKYRCRLIEKSAILLSYYTPINDVSIIGGILYCLSEKDLEKFCEDCDQGYGTVTNKRKFEEIH